MAEVVIADWQKNGRERLRIRLYSYKGQAVIDCRAWYTDDAGNLKPGRGGLTLSVRHLPALAEALTMALATAKAAGLVATAAELLLD